MKGYYFSKLIPAQVVILLFVLAIGYFNIGFFINQLEERDSSKSGKVEIRYAVESPASNGPRGGRSKKATEKKYYYRPAETEKFLIGHLDELGFNETDASKSKGCTTFFQHNDEKSSLLSNDVVSKFTNYVRDLTSNFTHHEQNFEPVHDIMKTIKISSEEEIPNICKALRLHNDGSINNFFTKSELSYSSRMGYMEPLLPPMRHPEFCKDEKYLLSLDYLVHDFEAMCNALKPQSKLVMIDMGADLARENGPVIKLLDLYSKFGFEFDHIYGYEMKFTDPITVYRDQLPDKYLHSFHWINVAVETEPDSNMNPLMTILSRFDEDDFIVVKLDVDHGPTEVPLAKQIYNSNELIAKIDQFYFEHHVNMEEIAPWWNSTMNGTVKESMELFYGLRQKGVASHFWV